MKKIKGQKADSGSVNKGIAKPLVLRSAIREFLLSTEWGGAVTETIAHKFNLTNRQVGSIMGKLSKAGDVKTYTKGAVWIKNGIHTKAAPMRLSNSFYEWVSIS